MGYTSLFYAVDLDRLNEAIGSNDPKYLKAFEEQFPDELDRRLDDDEPLLKDAFAELIARTYDHPDAGHQYGYALEILCRIVGEHLPDDDAIGDLAPLCLDIPLANLKYPVEIPKDLNDFPRISCLNPTEVHAELVRLRNIDLSFADDDDIEEARLAYAECVKEAAATNKSVVMFYY